MKKRILSMLLVIVLVLSLVPASALADGAWSISGTNYMEKGTGVTLTLKGVNATDAIEWKSNKESVATVLFEATNPTVCQVTGAGEGKTEIVATVNGEEKSFPVAVYLPSMATPEVVAADVVDLNGGVVTLNYTVSTGTEMQQVVRWKSSNPKVATISWKGELTPVAAGHTNITVFYNGQWSAPKDIEVKDMTVELVDFTLSKKSLNLTVEQSKTITVKEFVPADATDKTLTWSTNNPGVATVDAGMIKAEGTGTAIITAQHGSIIKTVTVTVSEAPVAVTSVTINDGQPSLLKGESMRLSATVLPENASEKQVTWTISPATAGEVDQTGLVTLYEAGAATSATVTATCGGVSGVFTFNIASPVSVDSVTVSQKDNLHTVPVNGTLKLAAKVAPDNATVQTVTWESSNKSIAKVNKNGLVTGVAQGSATITATCDGKSDTYDVTVTPASMIVHNVPNEVQAGKALDLSASCVDASGNPVPNTSVKWTLLSQEERVSLTGSKLETGSDMQYRHDILLRAEAVGCDAGAVNVTVTVIPVTTGITLKIGSEKVNNKTYVVDLSNAANAQYGIMISADIQPASAQQSIRWEIADSGNICTEKQMTKDVLLTPVKALKSGTVTVKAYAGDGTGAYATTTIQFSKLGSGKLKNVPTQLRGGASLNLATYLDQDKDLDDKTVTWSIQNNMLDGKKIATLGANGKLTTKAVTKPHTIKVTVTGSSGGYDTKPITLYPATKSITITGYSNTGVNINGTSKTIKYMDGLELYLTGNVKPTDADVWPLTWSSTNKKVATVDANGVVTVLDAGKVRIDCTTTDGSKIKGSVNLEITKNAKSVKITAPSKSLAMSQSMNLTATVMAGNGVQASNQNVTWEVTDVYGEYTDAAQITSTGRLEGIYVTKSTEVMVTATSVADPDVSGSIILTIVPDVNKTLHAMIDGKVIADTYSMDLYDFASVNGVWLKNNGNQTDAKDCTFISGDEDVVTVEDGELSAVGYGTAVITLNCTDPQTGDLFTNTFTVYVTDVVRDVTINVPDDAYYLRSGEILRLTATAWTYYGNGEDSVMAENQDFDWEVKEVVGSTLKNTNIVTIDSNGVLEADWVDKEHTIQVTAYSQENGVSASVTLKVYPADEMWLYFMFNGKEYEDILSLDYDELLKTSPNGRFTGLTVYAKTAPMDDYGNIRVNTTLLRNPEWESSNENVIEVSQYGALILNGTGSTRLTASGTEWIDGEERNYAVTITLNVNRLVGKVTIETSGVLASGKSVYLNAVVSNDDATNKTMQWSLDSASEEFATVERYTGKLSAKRGLTERKTITVTATPADGTSSYARMITIYPLTTKVEIKQGSKVINGTTVQVKEADKPIFTATATPSAAYQGAFMWTSSDPSVAEVDPDTGAVTIWSVGKTVIKATAVDGSNKTAKFTLRVK